MTMATRLPHACRFLLLTASLLSGGVARARAEPAVLINEILYDPTGADAGGEFVELQLASGAPSIALARLRLERGNGQRAGDWRPVWQGAPGESLHAGRHYVVGGDSVVPRPDAIAELELQNGPDACRLLLDGQVVDVVGWGELEANEFFAGAPCPDVEAGTSLGRIPDGKSTGNNRADFAPLAAPSPGRPNRRSSPVRLKSPRHHSRADPAPRLFLDFALEVAGEPADPVLGGAQVEVRAFLAADPARSVTATAVLVDGQAGGTLILGQLAPGTVTVNVAWQPRVSLEGIAVPPETVAVAARVGPGPLQVSEFVFRPLAGDPEWVELVNVSADTVLAADYALADAHSAPALLAGAPRVPPGGFLLVAAAPLPGIAEAVILGTSWPLLNDTGGPPADRIHLVDGAGRTSDDVAYASSWAAAGVSVERLSPAIPSEERGAWTSAPAGATPGQANGAAREFMPVHVPILVDPPVRRTAQATPVLLRLEAPLRSGAITIHAADGRLVRRFPPAEVAGRRWLHWDGGDMDGVPLPAGVYLISLAGEVDPPVPAGGGGSPSRAARWTEGRSTFVVAP
jgi:Lamin Tail Domain/FlgD Ig-like domain